MKHFGVGYCTKGLMKGRIAIPIRNRKAELVAYVGRSPSTDDTPDKYPEHFHKEWELFNVQHVIGAPQILLNGVILVPDVFDVFRLYEAGYPYAMALMDEAISPEQVQLLLHVIGRGEKVTLLFPHGSDGAIAVLGAVVSVFHVRLLRTAVQGTRPQDLTPAELHELLG